MKHLTDHTAARQTSLFRQIDWFTTLIPFLMHPGALCLVCHKP